MPKKRTDALPTPPPEPIPYIEVRLRQAHREAFEENPMLFAYAANRCNDLAKAQGQMQLETALARPGLNRALERAKKQARNAEQSLLDISLGIGETLATQGVVSDGGLPAVLTAKGSCQELESAAVNIQAALTKESQGAARPKPRSR